MLKVVEGLHPGARHEVRSQGAGHGVPAADGKHAQLEQRGRQQRTTGAPRRAWSPTGALVLFIGILAGLGLLISLLDGIERIPGSILPLSIPGQPDAGVRAQLGGMRNGILPMVVVAVVVGGLGFAENGARQVAWILIGTGWANTLIYWDALFAPNRALSFADNRFGSSNLATVPGLFPALAFVVILVVAVALVILQAFPRPA